MEAEISHLKKEEHRFERGIFQSLMEIYVPIYLGHAKKPTGVAEVYLNVDSLFATIRNTGWLIGLTVVGGLELLSAGRSRWKAFTGGDRSLASLCQDNFNIVMIYRGSETRRRIGQPGNFICR